MRLATYMAERERKVFAVGRIRAKKVRLTVFCGECGATICAGTAGAPTLASLCRSCRERHFPTDGDDR